MLYRYMQLLGKWLQPAYTSNAGCCHYQRQFQDNIRQGYRVHKVTITTLNTFYVGLNVRENLLTSSLYNIV